MLFHQPYLTKFALIILAFLYDYTIYYSRIEQLDSTVSLLAYIFLFSILFLAVFLSSFAISTVFRLFFAFLLSASWLLYDAYFRITGGFLSYDAFIQLYNSRGFTSQAIAQYLKLIFLSMPPAFLIFFAILLPPRPITSGPYSNHPLSRYFKKRLPEVFAISTIALLSLMLYMRGGDGANGLPQGLIVPAYASLMAFESMTESLGPRREVSILHHENHNIPKDIVFIIDESIRGDYLDINNHNGAPTGLLPALGTVALNFGYAASATNCSIGSNLILRFGAHREGYWKDIRTAPYIWDYAHNAGFRTVYIDAQSEDRLYNGMDDGELERIDDFIQYRNLMPYERDIAAAHKIAELTRNDKREFILINKLGAHFPINDKFPDSHAPYKPMLPRGRFKNVTIGKLAESFNNNWAQYKNSYKNTIYWSVGEFFRIILSKADLDNTLFIYTSDHGQNFHERGEPGHHTHCSIKGTTSMEEGLVPMVILTKIPQLHSAYQTAAHRNHDRTTHFNIFSTLLLAMGYDGNQVRRLYGKPLTDTLREPFAFNVRFYARLGRKPQWVKIDLNKIMGPPANNRAAATRAAP